MMQDCASPQQHNSACTVSLCHFRDKAVFPDPIQ